MFPADFLIKKAVPIPPLSRAFLEPGKGMQADVEGISTGKGEREGGKEGKQEKRQGGRDTVLEHGQIQVAG